MAFTRQMVNYDKGGTFELVIDAKKLSMSLDGAGEHDFKKTYPSFAALEADYRKRVVPYFRENDCYDYERSQEVDANQHLRELLGIEDVEPGRARAKGGKGAGGAKGPIDEAVAEVSQLLRKRLNAALGTKRCKLEAAVFLTDDGGITGVIVNPPALHGVDEADLEQVVEEDGWADGDFRTAAAWNLENGVVNCPELKKYGDPNALFGHCFRQVMHLACAHVEAAPNLRDNVTIVPGFRVMIAEMEEPWLDLELRAAARSHLGGPAKKYFDVTRDE